MAEYEAYLVPGWQVTRFVAQSKWKKIIDRLCRQGWGVHVSQYGDGEPMKDSISYYAAVVAEEFELFHPQVAFVHSMGGLEARWAIEQIGCGYPGLIVFLMEVPEQGLPSDGWSFGRLLTKTVAFSKKLPGRSWDLEQWDSWRNTMKGSRFLRQLNGGLSDPKVKSRLAGISYIEVGGFLAYHWPETFSLPPAINQTGALKEKRIFPWVGHSGLKTNPKVIDYMMKIINS